MKPERFVNESENKMTTALIIFAVGALCELPSMIKSGFLGRFGAEVLLSFVLLTAFVAVCFKIFGTKSSAYTASFVSLLLFGNWSQLMLYYTCGLESDEIFGRVTDFMTYSAVSVVGAWVLFIILDKIRHSKKICLVLFSAVSVGISAFALMTSGERSTSSTAGGFQPAILMMFVMLYAFSGATAGNHDTFTKIIYLGLFWLMCGSLAWKHEFGIPVMCCASCGLMYIFFNKSKKERRFIIANVLIPVVGLTAAMIKNPSLRTDTINKINERINETNFHWLTAQKNLSTSSLFGCHSYVVYLPEASTDYSLNTDVHYWGYIWLAVVVISFFFMTFSVYKDIMQKGDNVTANMRKLCYSAVCIILVYNILDNICGFPVVGVQNVFSGVSKSMGILSGLLAGSIMAEPANIKESFIAFLERTKLIMETTEESRYL